MDTTFDFEEWLDAADPCDSANVAELRYKGRIPMSKSTIGQFSFELFKRPKDASLPMQPFVKISLKHWGDTVGGPPGAPVISSQLMTDAEIDAHIKALKDDLDKVSSEAKGALLKAITY